MLFYRMSPRESYTDTSNKRPRSRPPHLSSPRSGGSTSPAPTTDLLVYPPRCGTGLVAGSGHDSPEDSTAITHGPPFRGAPSSGRSSSPAPPTGLLAHLLRCDTGPLSCSGSDSSEDCTPFVLGPLARLALPPSGPSTTPPRGPLVCSPSLHGTSVLRAIISPPPGYSPDNNDHHFPPRHPDTSGGDHLPPRHPDISGGDHLASKPDYKHQPLHNGTPLRDAIFKTCERPTATALRSRSKRHHPHEGPRPYQRFLPRRGTRGLSPTYPRGLGLQEQPARYAVRPPSPDTLGQPRPELGATRRLKPTSSLAGGGQLGTTRTPLRAGSYSRSRGGCLVGSTRRMRGAGAWRSSSVGAVTPRSSVPSNGATWGGERARRSSWCHTYTRGCTGVQG